HTVEAIRARLAEGARHNYLRDFLYGGIDGAVTTFAVVAGVTGASLAPGIVLILGVANLAADGFSMAASNYLGTRAEREDFKRLASVELRHIESDPEGEREEVRQIYARKGLSGAALEEVVDSITADHARWIETMLAEEYNLPREVRSAWYAAFATFVAFALCGSVPLAPYVVGVRDAFLPATLLTGSVFFAIGSLKARWSTAPWWRSGLTTLLIGAAAALLAYATGVLLKSLAA
ncbi:MAG TPA: VIT1/CCC1 transporter family protein, partial [Pyrinomonadaceae bacterium]|nr:VIT1/CCC1 transporter family protein [Pyrinomonadaceae bacterium]